MNQSLSSSSLLHVVLKEQIFDPRQFSYIVFHCISMNNFSNKYLSCHIGVEEQILFLVVNDMKHRKSLQLSDLGPLWGI